MSSPSRGEEKTVFIEGIKEMRGFVLVLIALTMLIGGALAVLAAAHVQPSQQKVEQLVPDTALPH
jgi:hypothetical protein